MKQIKYIVFIFILLLNFSILYADERSVPNDIIIALDKSLSMEEEINEVKRYVNEEIISGLINGDYLMIFGFYGQTKVLSSHLITASTPEELEKEKENIRREVQSIKADGRFTDIGNALDRLLDEFLERKDDGRDKYLLLVSDGIHEPMTMSRYYSENFQYTHKYKDDLKEEKSSFPKHGWKVQILAIGPESNLEEMAEDLHGEYVQTDDTVTAEEIKEKLSTPLATLAIVAGSERPLKLNAKGEGKLVFEVGTEDYKEDPVVELEGITLVSENYSQENILKEPSFSVTLPQKGITQLTFHIKTDPSIPEGEYPGTLHFRFTSKEKFDPQLEVIITASRGIFPGPGILIPLILLGAALIAGIIILLSRLGGKSSRLFKILVPEAPIPENKNRFKISKNKELYLTEVFDVISISVSKTRRSFGKISFTDKGIKMTPLGNNKVLNSKDLPSNILNHEFKIKTESGKTLSLTLVEI